ncbi:MAG: toxin-antitoxin system YwqK family antitoxin [Phycisphaerae bacterium]|nr:toxin-antitoxin system YwqK family antitoxin [Phycisphaerae bacterium]
MRTIHVLARRVCFVRHGVCMWEGMSRTRGVACGAVLLASACLGGGCAGQRHGSNPSDLDAALPANRTVDQENWPDGRPRLRAEMRVEPGGAKTLDGLYTLWFPTGQKQYEATYVDGRLHGTERQWHENGRLRVEQHYDHGLRHGPRYDWSASGQLRKEEHYDQDQPHGTWFIWDGKGKLKWQGRFDHGQPLP